MELKYDRILLKVSGESLAYPNDFGINFDNVLKICQKIKECNEIGVNIAIVVGGGNFWRGRSNEHMDRVTADHIGMMGTLMNALALGDAFKQLDSEVRVMTAIQMNEIAEHFSKNRALKHLDKNRIVIFGCGTGSPFFSTDTTASLRAAEINADAIIKLTNVDGVYDSDPKINKNAKKYDVITYNEVLEKNLKVMDGAAIGLSRDNKIPIVIINMNDMDNLKKVVTGEKLGTTII